MNAITKGGYQDVPMSRRRAQLLAEYAERLATMLENAPDDKDLAEWVQSKIDRAASAIQSAYHYLDQEDDLEKGAGHKYTHRKRVGTDKRGRARYRYYYQEHHGGGITRAKLEAGAAFKLTFRGRRGHFHIESVQGDIVTVKHDGRANSKPVQMTKAEFRALIKRQHGQALASHTEKLRRQVDRLKRNPTRKRSSLGLALYRLRQAAEKAGVALPEEYQRKPKKKTAQTTETPREDRFDTMPESTGTPLKTDGSLDLEKMTPDQVKEHLKYQAHVGLQVLTKSPEFQDLLKEAQLERERGKRAKRGSAQDRLNNAVSDIYGPSKIVPREQISEALGFKVVMTGDVYRAFEAETAEEIMDAKFDELGRKFGLGEDEPPVPYSNWLKQVKEVEQEAYKREDQRALVALKGASVGDVITYQNIPFEVRTIEEHQYRGTIYGVRLSDPKTHTPKRAPVSATFDVKGDQLRFENQPVDEKGIRFYEGDFDRGIDPNTYGENMKGAEGEFEYAWRTQTREEALKTPYEIPADKIPASLKTEQPPTTARDQLTSTAQEIITEADQDHDERHDEHQSIEQFELGEHTHTKTGVKLFTAKQKGRTDRDEYRRRVEIARKHNGRYERRYVKGFLFKTAEDARNFALEVEGVQVEESAETVTPHEDHPQADNFETMVEVEATEPDPSPARQALTETAEEIMSPSTSALNIDQANAQDTLTENRTRNPESKATDKALIESARELAKTSERGDEIRAAVLDLMNAQQLKRYKRATGETGLRAEDMIEKRRAARERLRGATSGATVQGEVLEAVNQSQAFINDLIFNKQGKLTRAKNRNKLKGYSDNGARSVAGDIVSETMREVSPHLMNHTNRQSYENQARVNVARVLSESKGLTREEIAVSIETVLRDTAQKTGVLNPPKEMILPKRTGEISEFGERLADRETVEIDVSPTPTTAREQITETAREVVQGADNFETMPEVESTGTARGRTPEAKRYKRVLSLAKKAERLDKLKNNRRSKASKEADQALIDKAQEILDQDFAHLPEVRDLYRKPSTMWTREEERKVAIFSAMNTLKDSQRANAPSYGGAEKAREERSNARAILEEQAQERVDEEATPEELQARSDREEARNAREVAKQEAREAQEARLVQQKTFTPEIQSAIDNLRHPYQSTRVDSFESHFKTRKDGGVFRSTLTPKDIAVKITSSLPQEINQFIAGKHTLSSEITTVIEQGIEDRKTIAEIKDMIGEEITTYARDVAVIDRNQIHSGKALVEFYRNITALTGTGLFDGDSMRREERFRRLPFIGLERLKNDIGDINERIKASISMRHVFTRRLSEQMQRYEERLPNRVRFNSSGPEVVTAVYAEAYPTVGDIRENISEIRDDLRTMIKEGLNGVTSGVANPEVIFNRIKSGYEKATEQKNRDREESIERSKKLAQYTDDPQAHLAEIQERERKSAQEISEQVEVNSEFADAYLHEASKIIEDATENTKGELIDKLLGSRSGYQLEAPVEGRANRKLIARIFNEVFEQVRREIGDEPIERGEKHPRNIADTVKKPSKTPAQVRDDQERDQEEKKARARAKKEARRARRTQKSALHLTNYRADLYRTIERLAS